MLCCCFEGPLAVGRRPDRSLGGWWKRCIASYNMPQARSGYEVDLVVWAALLLQRGCGMSGCVGQGSSDLDLVEVCVCCEWWEML